MNGRPTRLRELTERAVFIVMLGVLTIPVYAPSLSRFFASDQVVYFAELDGDRSLGAGLRFLDYSLAHKYDKGDEALYRPLLFALLAVENTLFGYDYTLWNLLSLVLHLTVAYLLYELLRSIGSPIFATAFALLFAVNRSQVEMVMWNHLSGYLMAFVFLLLALIAVHKVTASAAPAWHVWLPAYAIAVTATMSLHEAGVFLALLVPAYLYWHSRQDPQFPKRSMLVATTIPLVLFCSLYTVHLARCPRIFWVDRQLTGGFQVGQFLLNLGQCLWLWPAEAVNPWRSELVQVPLARFLLAPRSEPDQAYLILMVIVLFLVFIICVRPAVRFERVRARGPFLTLILLMVLVYAGLVNLGRSNAVAITYYLYPFCLLGTVAVFTLIEFDQLPALRKLVCGVVLLIFVIGNAVVTHNISKAVAASNALCTAYYSMVHEFIQKHKDEPDFSFVPRDVPSDIDPQTVLHIGYPDEPSGILRVHVSGMLYLRYYNPTTAKYSINFNPESGRQLEQPRTR